jgi:hypothetical protein
MSEARKKTTTPKKPALIPPIALLSFVTDREPTDDNNLRRVFWHVSPSGDFHDNCTLGRAYGEEAARYLQREGLSPALGWIVMDMIRAFGGKVQQPDSGLVVGFMTYLAGHVAQSQVRL